ncbi:HAD family hydrolase [Mucilaginibacter sp. Bleaf8]|uniref:HAD family hydrolase n=1 Tax=Mucilaginibacter sp. Bleaf8 TaxID=2834430 RepID=UPI001BCACB68|nr:HAD family hydrolase [Mucilaginibacter sp. Bleaf8]MBS7563050.1 HAD family hydrolase [Mucilaginibacter sp. Bleaf8]
MQQDLKHKFDSIIFDLDGTLWDSTVTVANAWQKAKNEVDYITNDITADDVRGIAGMAYDAIFEKLFPYLTPEVREEFKSHCAKYELEMLNAYGGELYPDLKATLQDLASRYKLFVVSNCQCGYIELFLTLNNLESTFAGHQCYGTKTQPKYLNIIDIIKDHNLQNPVYVGDTQGDLDSSTKAGVPMIYAAYGFGKTDGSQIADIAKFSDLKETL